MPMLNDPVSSVRKPNMSRSDLIGIVVSNVDDDDKRQRQRVRIRVPQLHRNVPDEDLPWAIPDVSNSYSNAGQGVGSVNIPPIGSKVFVRYHDNDPHNPRYSGSPSTDDVSSGNELLNEDYPHTRGSIDAANNRYAVNVEKNTIDRSHSSGTTEHIDANGTVSQTIAGDWNVGVNGDVNIIASGVVRINGAEIRFNDGNIEVTTPTQRTRPSIPSPAGKDTY